MGLRVLGLIGFRFLGLLGILGLLEIKGFCRAFEVL